jgi:hypothetical protein
MQKKRKPSLRRRERLDAAKLKKVRALIAEKKYADSEIARREKIHRVTVGRIRRREMYAGVR